MRYRLGVVATTMRINYIRAPRPVSSSAAVATVRNTSKFSWIQAKSA